MRKLWIIVGVMLVAISTAYQIAHQATSAADKGRKEHSKSINCLEVARSREKSMVRLTERPFEMDLAIASLCRAPLPKETPEINPHLNHYVHVYVTPGGEQKIRTNAGTYPTGTLIIKEKFPGMLQVRKLKDDAKSAAPELFTAMLKREAGYHPDCGDWEFLVFSGDLTSIIARGKLESCVDCHQAYDKTDYVVRNYIRPER